MWRCNPPAAWTWAIEYIHSQLVAERDKGKAVLLVSLELDEVMSLSDRILVIYEGEIVGELDPAATDVQELGLYMAGAKRMKKRARGVKQKLSNLWGKDGTKSVLASLISILIGMVVGALIIIIVGAANPSLGLNSAWRASAWCSAACSAPDATRRAR